MFFNSVHFIIFFSILFLIYNLLGLKQQNFLLLLASYFFYAYWDYRFLSLLILCTCVSYFCGLLIYKAKNDRSKKIFLIINIILSLSVLFTFKYLNFFLASTELFARIFGFSLKLPILNIILPLGISFFTFQSLSYPIDVFRGKLKATNNILNYALYISFFPQLIMGPIERAGNLLPQFARKREVNKDKFYSSLFLILSGYFKKTVIADHLEIYTSNFFNFIFGASTLDFIVMTIIYTIQVYYDFSGYIDIARGIAGTLGFDLSMHFNKPFFAKNPVDFWRRWQISLAEWFRDYLFIPIAIPSIKKGYMYLPHIITMLLVGVWHGASYKFLIFGLYWGIFLVFYIHYRKYYDKLPLRIILTFCITCFSMLLSRIERISDLKHIWVNLSFSFYRTEIDNVLISVLAVAALLLIIEGITLFKPTRKDYYKLLKSNSIVRYLSVFILIFIIVFYRAPEPFKFRYFLF